MAKYIICRDSQSGLSGSITYLTASELWSADIDNAVSFSEKEASAIARDYFELSQLERKHFQFSIISSGFG